MYSAILTSLLPIFLIIGLGALLRGRKFLPVDVFPFLNRLAFFIGLPALLFLNIATSTLEGGPALRIFWVILVATAATAALAIPIARKLRLDGPATGSFLQATLRGNLAYIGLPVVIYAMVGSEIVGEAGIETTAMLVLAPTVPLYNIVSVIVLVHYAKREAAAPAGVVSLSLKVLQNPLLIACLLGIIVAWLGWVLPMLLQRTLQPLAQMALPLALLSIGASLKIGREMGGNLSAAMIASLLKVGLTPLLGYFIARWFGLEAMELRMALLFLACPTAVTGFVMAEQLGADKKLAGDAVVISTLLSFFAIALVMIVT